MIGEIRRVKFDAVGEQLPLFYKPELINQFVLVTFLPTKLYAHVFNNGCVYVIPCEYLKHVS